MTLHLTITCIFFFNDTATTEIYTLSLHDALPIYRVIYDLRRPTRGGLHRGAAGHRADSRLHRAHGDRAVAGRRHRRARGQGPRGLLLYVETRESSKLSMDRRHFRRTDSRDLVLVYRSAHRAAGARRTQHQGSAHP